MECRKRCGAVWWGVGWYLIVTLPADPVLPVTSPVAILTRPESAPSDAPVARARALWVGGWVGSGRRWYWVGEG